MNEWWFALDKHFSDDEIQKILGLYQDPNKGQVGFDQTKEVDFVRRSMIVGFEFMSPGHKIISEILDPIVHLANREAFGFDISGISEYQIARYNVSEYYKEHMDCRLRGVPSTRKLSVTVQLSDPSCYEGGDFLFGKDIPQPPEEVKNKGSVLVFPSFLYHQITPVKNGDRFSLVGWYEGPQWR